MNDTRPTTYGEHAELAAAAFTRLIADDALPTDDTDIDLLLRYRDVIVDSFRQRLFDLGALPSVDRPLQPRAPWEPYRDALIPFDLAAVASALPRSQDADAPAPTDLFANRSRSVIVDRWRTAAIESLAASNALSGNVRTWTTEKPDARWLVIRDLAVGLESVTLLDDHLREVGLLNRHDSPRPPGDTEAIRAVLAHAARISSWRAATDTADHLTPATRPDLAAEHRTHGPVRLVSDVADLAAAQTRLAQSLAPMASQNAAFTGEPHISARTARLVVAGQIFVAQVTQRLLGPEALRAEDHRHVEARSQQLVDIDRRIAYLVDDDPSLRTAGTLSYWQQSEITTSLQRLTRHHEIRSFTTAEAEALEVASRSACRNFGAALRRELVREDSNLRLADPTQQVGAARVTRRSALGQALNTLIDDSTPERPSTPSIDVQRAVLQHTVNTTPTVRRPARRTALNPTR